MVSQEGTTPVAQVDQAEKPIADYHAMAQANGDGHAGQVSVMQIAFHNLTGEVRSAAYVRGAIAAKGLCDTYPDIPDDSLVTELREMSGGYYELDLLDPEFQQGVARVLAERNAR